MKSNVVELYSTKEPIFGMDLNKIIDRRIDLKFFLSVKNSNLQGDPENNNNPRMDVESQIGIMTPMGIKRQLRDAANTILGLPIYVARNAVFSRHVAAVAQKLGIDISGLPEEEEEGDETKSEADKKAKPRSTRGKARLTDAQKLQIMEAVAKEFWDAKMFGQLFTKPINYSIRGPVQVSFVQSVHKIEIQEHKIGRVAVASEDEKSAGKNTMFGDLNVIGFGLFEGELCITPSECEKTGVTWGDVEQLVSLFPVMFTISKSTTRFGVAFERAYVFMHSCKYGNIGDHKLFRACTATRNAPKNMETVPEEQWPYPRSIDDFTIALDRSKVPAAVKVIIID
jgi:CRISPR-associated protein Csd2